MTSPKADSERWFPRNRLVAWLSDWIRGSMLGVLVLTFVLMLMSFGAGLPWLLLAVTAMALAVMLLPYGWRVDDEGLHSLRLGRPSSVIPWSRIRRVEMAPPTLRIELDRRVLRLPLQVPGTRLLAARLRAGLGIEDAPAAEPVTPEVVANWLEIEPEDHLECGLHPGVRGLVTGYVALCAAGGLVAACLPGPGTEDRWWLVYTALAFGLCSWFLWRETAPPLATAHGLRDCRGRFIPWDEVTGVQKSGVVWLAVSTEQDTVYIRGRNGRRVAATIDRTVAAREAGRTVHRMTDIPDHALSRAESIEVSAERGISPAEDLR